MQSGFWRVKTQEGQIGTSLFGNWIVICGATLTTGIIDFPFATDSNPLALGPICPTLCISYLNPETCAGQSYGSCGSGYTYSWRTNDPSIATLDSPGTLATATFFGAGPGQGSATGEVSSQYCHGYAGGTPKVQTPHTLQGPTMEQLLTYTNQTYADCNLTILYHNIYGYSRCADYTVWDQFSPTQQIKVWGLQFDEIIDNVHTNLGNLEGDEGSGATNVNYVMQDSLYLLSTVPLPPNAYVYERQTIKYSPTAATVRVNCLHKTSSDLTVTDITTNPDAPCQP